MQICPAIDLINGQVVRLNQGRFNETTKYAETPEAMLMQYIDAGAAWIHIVNLDAARGLKSKNTGLIESLLKLAPGRIEIGGGIHTTQDAARWLDQGAGRIIVGSAAVGNPKWVAELVESFGADSIVAGIDCIDGHVAIKGWTEIVEITGIMLAQQMFRAGIKRAIVTDIATDGMLVGPNLPFMEDIATASGLKIIVSGGVSCMDDLAAASQLTDRGIEGIIIGKAIYEGRIDINEAITQYQITSTE
ncbi:1-(5-phosphoribosyl)-5-[(5-phosphoribosylamino)methylideneamino]imidazole-4-carboxamide isomerase [bacterium]|nr:1-(5-phosphoribosyl)-5-[(5-phosphoribosylamino)methylideneamino]imidazole-4-carboxamide isomerase [bacterium]